MFKGLNRIIYQVPDLEQAKNWYCKILEEEPVLDSPVAVHFRIGESGLTLIPGTSKPDFQPGKVIAYWEVEDVDASFRDLLAAGCVAHQEARTTLNRRLGSVIDPFGNVIGLVGNIQASQAASVEEKPSETALAVTSLRALAFHDEREEVRGKDSLAEIFLTEDQKKPLTDLTVREWVLKKAIPAGLYEYLIARTAYVDSVVEKALKCSIPQLVFLGAGYDSRPYRFRKLIQTTKIFELDAGPTQERKSAMLQQAGIPIPENVTLIPVNFNNEQLEDVLSKAGFNQNQQTLFLWEGVTFYLTAPVIDQVLACIVHTSPAGSEICFDFQSYSEEGGLFQTKSPGEPIRFGIKDGMLESFLGERGLRMMEHVTAQEMEKKYLTLNNGTVIGNINPLLHFARAEVC